MNAVFLKLEDSPTVKQLEKISWLGLNSNDIGYYSNGSISVSNECGQVTIDIEGNLI